MTQPPLILEEVVSSPQGQTWKGLKLELQQGLDSAGSFYNQLVSTILRGYKKG
ncbi:MAG: hypothetical protein V7K35_04660 [Nostoc sp.]